MYLNTGAENDINIVLQHIFRQTIARNAVTQHAAQLRTLFVNNRLVTHQLQIECTAQAARTAADDGNALACRRLIGNRCDVQRVGDRVMLDAADVDGVIHHVSAAARLTRVLTDKCAGGRERIVLADEFNGVLAATGAHQCDVARNIHVSWTKGNAWNRLRQTAGTAVVAYVFLIIVAEALHATQHHAGSFIANGAVCGF